MPRKQGLSHETFADQLKNSLGASTGRLSAPKRFARLVAFVASPTNITSAEYIIDGGVVKSL